MKENELTKAEELVLLTVMRLKDQVYGVTIKTSIKETSGKTMPYGTLYFLLDKLTLKGLVEKQIGEPTAQRGGRAKTFYSTTSEGIDALKAAFEQQSRIWASFASMQLDEGFGE